MKKYIIVICIACTAVFSYVFLSGYRFKDVRKDFTSENPGCKVISIYSSDEGKKKLHFWIKYKREGDDRVYETRYFFQRNVDSGKWDDLKEKDFDISQNDE